MTDRILKWMMMTYDINEKRKSWGKFASIFNKAQISATRNSHREGNEKGDAFERIYGRC